jgi:DNA primase
LAVGVAAEVKNRLSVVEVVGESVQLKKAGTTLKGLCPFHAEKTPSFIVTPGRETWHCFGCGEGGDIFSFVMKRDGVAFPEALRVLAAKAGVELDDRTRKEDARKARLREVLETSIAFYHTVLQHRTGQAALDYLRGRGFTDETISTFQLGYAPGGWDTMSRTLQTRRNIAPAELAEVGLTTPRSSGRGAYDRFRERIIFPIRDASGGAIGLGGRILPALEAPAVAGGGQGSGAVPASSAGGQAQDRGPKYLNSPATPLFDKSRTLYLIDRAKTALRKTGQAVIVEGYTDALMAHQAGFTDVVASLGTALTAGQVALVTRYAEKVALAYDVDPAGQKAGTFGITELSNLISELAQGAGSGVGPDGKGLRLTEVGVVRLPEGRDPDEVIRETPDLWRESVRAPQPILAYLIDTQAERVDLKTPEGRKRLVDAVLPTLRRVTDPILRDSYLQVLAKRSGVEERILLEALHQGGRPGRVDGGRQGAGGPGAGGRPGGGREAGPGAGAETGAGRITADAVIAARDLPDPEELVRSIDLVEAELLRLLLVVPDEQLRVADRLTAEMFPSELARGLWRAMLADRESDAAARDAAAAAVGGVGGASAALAHAGEPGRFERGRFLAALDEESRALAIALYASRAPVPGVGDGPDVGSVDFELVDQGVDQCLLRLELDRLDERGAWTRGELADAEMRGDADAISRLMDDERRLNEARLSLHRRIEQASLLARTAGGRP